MNQKTLLQALSIAMCLLCTINVVAQEAYVAYHESDYSLVFFYDNYRSYHQEPTYDLNTVIMSNGWKSPSHLPMHAPPRPMHGFSRCTTSTPSQAWNTSTPRK